MRSAYLGKRVHFIGIGGISLSALAKLAISFGAEVSGSDQKEGEKLNELRLLGAKVWTGSHPELIDADIAVFTSAIAPDDPELVFVKKNVEKVFERHEFLGQISRGYKKVIAVSGTHGKTTTTAMLTEIFKAADMSFTAHIGGDIVGSSNLVGSGTDYFITEACEYKRSFLSLMPDIAVILNVESDHPDCFTSDADLCAAFSEFAKNVKENGSVVVKQGYEDICKDAHTVSFAFKNSCVGDCAYEAVKIQEHNMLENSFSVYEHGEKLCDISLSLFGAHNILNAIASCAAARLCGIDIQTIKRALENFSGVKRRFEQTGTINGASVIFDYAHHPSEIRAAISVARKMFPRLAVIFQPHTYSRTKSLLPAFMTCFSEADALSILPTYPAREKESEGYSAERLFTELLCKHQKTALTSRYNKFGNLLEAACYIQKSSLDFDCFLLLGAGDIIDIDKMLPYDKG